MKFSRILLLLLLWAGLAFVLRPPSVEGVSGHERSRFTKPTFGQIAASNYKQHPRYRGVVGHWMFLENSGLTVRDISGYKRHGTMVNMPVDSWTPSNVDVSFGGSNLMWLDAIGGNDYIATANIPLGPNNHISLTAWVKTGNAACTGNSGLCYIISTSRFVGDMPYALYTTADRFSGTLGNHTARCEDPTAFAGSPIWRHVAFTTDGSTGTLYRDGDEVDTCTSMTPSVDAGLTVIGGDDAVSTYRPWHNQIAEIRIYHRILTANEVKSMWTRPWLEFYQRARTYKSIPAGPATFWNNPSWPQGGFPSAPWGSPAWP